MNNRSANWVGGAVFLFLSLTLMAGGVGVLFGIAVLAYRWVAG